MGFESSRIARRRLAALATTNERVHEALTPSTFPGLFEDSTTEGPADVVQVRTHEPSATATVSTLARQLDELARDIVATPGAGGALLAAYAAQARALTMVIEATRRSSGSPLPASVVSAAQSALHTPSALSGLMVV